MTARPLPRLLLALLPALAVAAPALAEPSHRAGGSEPRFTLAVDAFFADLTGPDYAVGLKTNRNLAFTGGDTVGMDLGRSTVPRVKAVFHAAEGGRLWVSWRRYDEQEEERFTHGAGFFPTLSSPGVGIDFADRIDSELDVRLEILDAGWSQTVAATKSAELAWIAGVRSVRYESDWRTDYDRGADRVSITGESDGLGLHLGLGGRYRFNGALSVKGRASAGLLRGESDARFEERAGGLRAGIRREGDDRVFRTLDLECRLVVSLTRSVDFSVGYELMRLDDLALGDRIVDDVQRGRIESRREAVTLDGFVAGVAYSW